MLHAAPVRLSITTGWPHFAASRSKTMRGMASALPPGGKGTMTRIGCEGYSTGRPCAAAGMLEIALDIAHRTTMISLSIGSGLLAPEGYSIATIIVILQ